MNYYIQGDEANADKIKAAFEKLGYDTGNLRFNLGSLYYTIEGKVELMCSEAFQNLIKTHPDYKELELPVDPKFKVGDWITDGNITIQIENIRNNSYTYSDGVLYSTRIADKVYHLWSIADVKDGDVLCTYECGEPKIVFINRLIRKNGSNIFMYYCFYNIMYPRFDANKEPGCLAPKREDVKPATKEQRDLLFKKMREAGYTWDEKKKELHRIQAHYDIANFKPFDKVLVRDTKYGNWNVNLFSYYIDDIDTRIVARFCCMNSTWIQCIPYNDDTKHLLGTTDMCPEEYINW